MNRACAALSAADMRLDLIPPMLGKSDLRVVIETPKGCRNKYAYDPELEAICLRKLLPEGMVFPCDFGFIPQTSGEDGAPLDVLVLMDESTWPGCVVGCRLIGVMEAQQTESGERRRNDRFIAVAQASLTFQHIRRPEDLPAWFMEQIEAFFMSYNKLEGKRFKPLRLAGTGPALKLIEAGRIKAE
jgi:inorganic pyrophosphatase